MPAISDPCPYTFLISPKYLQSHQRSQLSLIIRKKITTRLVACDCDGWHQKIFAAFIKRQTKPCSNQDDESNELTMRMQNKQWLRSEKTIWQRNLISDALRIFNYRPIIKIRARASNRRDRCEKFFEKFINIRLNGWWRSPKGSMLREKVGPPVKCS